MTTSPRRGPETCASPFRDVGVAVGVGRLNELIPFEICLDAILSCCTFRALSRFLDLKFERTVNGFRLLAHTKHERPPTLRSRGVRDDILGTCLVVAVALVRILKSFARIANSFAEIRITYLPCVIVLSSCSFLGCAKSSRDL